MSGEEEEEEEEEEGYKRNVRRNTAAVSTVQPRINQGENCGGNRWQRGYVSTLSLNNVC